MTGLNNDTIMALVTHFIDKAVISEYVKMKNTPNVDTVLIINNSSYKCEIKNRIESKIFFNIEVNCFFFDEKLHDEMGLPYFTYDGPTDFVKNMLLNADYKFYYLRKYFPNYKYYWLIEYDVFCNATSYQGFLNKYNENNSDLLITGFHKEQKEGNWYWTYGTDWIYNSQEIYGSFFPVVRLSANAIDFLYQRRLEHKKIFVSLTDSNIHWISCEVFVPTELINNDFSCESFVDEPYIRFRPSIYLNDDRIFNNPDDHLYHPVKSIINEITKLNDEISTIKKQYQELLNLFKKVFFTQFVQRLIETNSLLEIKYGIQFEKNFSFVLIPLSEDAGLRYEAHFSNDSIQMLLNFQGKYVDEYLNNVIIDLKRQEKMQYFTLYKSPRGGGIFLAVKKIDDVSVAITAMKFLIDNTYPILKDNGF